jgi:hypothetical protein
MHDPFNLRMGVFFFYDSKVYDGYASETIMTGAGAAANCFPSLK